MPTNTIVTGPVTGGGVAAEYDVVISLLPDEDPAGYAAAGATWRFVSFQSESVTADQVSGVLRDGP
jgi:hypothetical protein